MKEGNKMKKVNLELSEHEVELIICAINDDMGNFL